MTPPTDCRDGEGTSSTTSANDGAELKDSRNQEWMAAVKLKEVVVRLERIDVDKELRRLRELRKRRYYERLQERRTTKQKRLDDDPEVLGVGEDEESEVKVGQNSQEDDFWLKLLQVRNATQTVVAADVRDNGRRRYRDDSDGNNSPDENDDSDDEDYLGNRGSGRRRRDSAAASGSSTGPKSARSKRKQICGRLSGGGAARKKKMAKLDQEDQGQSPKGNQDASSEMNDLEAEYPPHLLFPEHLLSLYNVSPAIDNFCPSPEVSFLTCTYKGPDPPSAPEPRPDPTPLPSKNQPVLELKDGAVGSEHWRMRPDELERAVSVRVVLDRIDVEEERLVVKTNAKIPWHFTLFTAGPSYHSTKKVIQLEPFAPRADVYPMHFRIWDKSRLHVLEPKIVLKIGDIDIAHMFADKPCSINSSSSSSSRVNNSFVIYRNGPPLTAGPVVSGPTRPENVRPAGHPQVPSLFPLGPTSAVKTLPPIANTRLVKVPQSGGSVIKVVNTSYAPASTTPATPSSTLIGSGGNPSRTLPSVPVPIQMLGAVPGASAQGPAQGPPRVIFIQGSNGLVPLNLFPITQSSPTPPTSSSMFQLPHLAPVPRSSLVGTRGMPPPPNPRPAPTKMATISFRPPNQLQSMLNAPGDGSLTPSSSYDVSFGNHLNGHAYMAPSSNGGRASFSRITVGNDDDDDDDDDGIEVIEEHINVPYGNRGLGRHDRSLEDVVKAAVAARTLSGETDRANDRFGYGTSAAINGQDLQMFESCQIEVDDDDDDDDDDEVQLFQDEEVEEVEEEDPDGVDPLALDNESAADADLIDFEYSSVMDEMGNEVVVGDALEMGAI